MQTIQVRTAPPIDDVRLEWLAHVGSGPAEHRGERVLGDGSEQGRVVAGVGPMRPPAKQEAAEKKQ